MIDKLLKEQLIDFADEGPALNDAELVETSKWICDCKYQESYKIVKYQDRYYIISYLRSGSYFTEYSYEEPEVSECFPREKTITEWVSTYD